MPEQSDTVAAGRYFSGFFNYGTILKIDLRSVQEIFSVYNAITAAGRDYSTYPNQDVYK